MPTSRAQRGVFLLEALIGIVIFAIGVLAMIALQARAIDVQSDTQYRVEAAALADQLLANIVLGVDRSSPANLQNSLTAFAHRTTTTAACDFSGADSTAPAVTAWVAAATTDAATRLPGSAANMQQILVNTGTSNRVTISLCWAQAADAVPRRHTLISYVN